VDPLVLLDQAVAQEKVPRAIAKKVRLKMKMVQGAVQRVEKASGLRYPPYYIEPTLPVSKSGAEYGQMGVLFARVIPTTVTGNLVILVQFSAALVAYGTKGTIEAVAAHEFTHYVDLVRKISTGAMTSDERTTPLPGIIRRRRAHSPSEAPVLGKGPGRSHHAEVQGHPERPCAKQEGR